MSGYFPKRLRDFYNYIAMNANIDLEQLASTFEKSTRSIRTYIDEINDALKEDRHKIILDKKTKCFRIEAPIDFTKNVKWSNSGIIPETPEERLVYLGSLLLFSDDYQTIASISEGMHVSNQTVTNDLRIIKELADKYSVTIQQKPHYGIRVDGTEYQKRRLLIDILNHKYEFKFSDIYDIFSSQNVDLETIRLILKKVFDKHRLEIQDFQMDSLAMHLAIIILRIMDNHYLEEHICENININTITYEIISLVSGHYNIVFRESEIEQFNLQLLSKLSVLAYSDVYAVEQFINKFIDQLVEETGYNFKNDEVFYQDIKTHFSFFLERIKYQQYYRNPLLLEIKKKYQFEYNITLKCLKAVMADNMVPEDEVSFIALHVCAFFERNSYLLQGDKVNIILVCGMGVGTSRLIEAKLKAAIEIPFVISKIMSWSTYNDQEILNCDFIICTIPLTEKNVPVVFVDPLLEKKDIEQVRALMLDHYQDKNFIEKLIAPENFLFSTKKYKNYVGIILDVAQELRKGKYVDEMFEQYVLERELLSSTIVGNRVAIPHSLNGGICQPFIHVLILEQSVNWNSTKKVQIVFTLGLTNTEISQSRIFHDKLYSLVSNQDKLNKLLKVRNYEDFIACFCDRIQ